MIALCFGPALGYSISVGADPRTCERIVTSPSYQNARIAYDDAAFARPHWRRILESSTPAVTTGFPVLIYLLERGGRADVNETVSATALITRKSEASIRDALNMLRSLGVVFTDRGRASYDVVISAEGLLKTDLFVEALRTAPLRPRRRP